MFRQALMILAALAMLVPAGTGWGVMINDAASDAKGRSAGTFDLGKKTVLLNSGHEMPVIGLGTWTLSNRQAEEIVYGALKCGVRLIDTARYYRCEAGVGRGVKRAMVEGIVSREDVFITSKIMPGDYGRAAQGIEDSLRELDVSYVDLMLIHQPGPDDRAVYRALEEAVKDGKVRSIGISNYYTREALDAVLAFARITPAVIQNENHLLYQNDKLREYASTYGIVMESWYPLGGRGHVAEHLGNPVVTGLAAKYGRTPAQIILRWHIQAGYVAIPGTSDPAHAAENFGVFDFSLTGEEMRELAGQNAMCRYETW